MSKADECRALLAKEAEHYLDAALAEAREHRDEDLREMARNRAMRAAACRDESDYETAARFDAQASVLREALAGKPPPDTGWRDRPPTPEEAEAHDEEHRGYFSGAPWAVRVKADHPGDDHEWGVVWHTPSSYAPWAWDDVHKEVDYFDRWRPLSRDMFPARWPPPERDVECLCGNNVGAICPLHSSGAD